MVDPFTFGIAFVGGIVSFFSPCVFPLIPGYLGHLAGVDIRKLENSGIEKNKSPHMQRRIFVKSIFFVAGFASIFTILGLALAGAIDLFGVNQVWLNRIGGAVIIVFGLHTAKLIEIPGLNRQHRLESNSKPQGSNLSSAALGVSFGAGWTPCFSPILGSILIIAGSTASLASGAALLSVYSLGLGIPFLVAGFSTARFSNFVIRLGARTRIFAWASGAILIALGIVVFTGSFVRLLSLVYSVFGVPPTLIEVGI